VAGMPVGYKPAKGHNLLRTMGDVAIYKYFSCAAGPVSLGKLNNNGIELLQLAANVTMQIESIK